MTNLVPTKAEHLADIAAAQNRANHTGTQPVSTVTGLAAVATSGAAADVGLGNVANLAPANLPISTAAQVQVGGQISANGAPTADPTLAPFAANSPWRLGISQNAVFAPASDARNTSMGSVDGSGQAWINTYQYSHPIAYAATTDPTATTTDTAHTSTTAYPLGGAWQEIIPTTARIAGGTDRHMHIITPDRRTILEHFGATRIDSTHYNVTRRHQVSLTGSGIGPQNGTRAYGGSAIGGLIRTWEIDPTNPAYTGEIRHPLAMALRVDQLKYTGVGVQDTGYGDAYNGAGYGLKLGYVWPATEQDYLSPSKYTGQVPMGSYFAIPPSIDITTLGLNSAPGLMLAKAMQDYGAYVTDASGTTSLYVEDDGSTVTGVFASALKGSDYSSHDLKILYHALRVVASNGPSTPNGGPLDAPRRGAAQSVTSYPPIRTTPPDPSTVVAYIDASTVPPALKGWNGTAWVAIGGTTAPSTVVTTTDNGDGTFAITGVTITDNGDGTFTSTGTVIDNGDGTFAMNA